MADKDFGLDRAGVLERIARLPNFPKDFVVVGSSALALHGLRWAPRLDLLVGTQLWGRCVYGSEWITGYWDPPNQNIIVGRSDTLGLELYRDLTIPGCPLTFDQASRVAVKIAGVPCVPLPLLASWKRARGRSQDWADVSIIESWQRGSG